MVVSYVEKGGGVPHYRRRIHICKITTVQRVILLGYVKRHAGISDVELVLCLTAVKLAIAANENVQINLLNTGYCLCFGIKQERKHSFMRFLSCYSDSVTFP